MHVVAVLALDNVMPFELAIPHRISARRPTTAAARSTGCSPAHWDGQPVRTNADFTVAVDHGPKAIRTADTVVIRPFGAFDRRCHRTWSTASPRCWPA